MAHFSHPRELEPPLAREAARTITAAGAVIRTQAPLIRTVNDDPGTWAAMWRAQLRLQMVPYYTFIERDTGPQDYFAVPLARAYETFRTAFGAVSGLARTVRGPSMSATAGKITIDGITSIGDTKVFILRMLQARDPSLAGIPFFARYDPDATWFSDLTPEDSYLEAMAADNMRAWRVATQEAPGDSEMRRNLRISRRDPLEQRVKLVADTAAYAARLLASLQIEIAARSAVVEALTSQAAAAQAQADHAEQIARLNEEQAAAVNAFLDRLLQTRLEDMEHKARRREWILATVVALIIGIAAILVSHYLAGF